jgi:uncharacterized coiled-coil DUF342 family protein
MSDEVARLQDQMDVVEAQATALRDTLRAMDATVERWAATRDALNEKGHHLRDGIRRLKAQRDLVHGQIQALKVARDTLRLGLQDERQQYRAVADQLRSLPTPPRRSADEVRQRIEQLDWDIQTQSLTPDQEARLLTQIRALEQEGVIHRDRSRVHGKMKGLRQAMATADGRLVEVTEQIRSLAAKSQEHHLQMLATTEAFRGVKAEADHAHHQFLACLTEAKALRAAYAACLQQRRDLTTQLHRLEAARRQRLVDAEAEAQRKTATEKLKDRKKLSFEEFKALLDKGLV